MRRGRWGGWKNGRVEEEEGKGSEKRGKEFKEEEEKEERRR